MDTLNNCEARTDYVVKKKAKVYQKERNIEKLLDALGDCFVEKKVKITQKKRGKSEKLLDALDDSEVGANYAVDPLHN